MPMSRKDFLAGADDLWRNREIEAVAAELVTKVDDQFFTVPTSRSGKYHPAWANEDGGLARHSLAVARLAPYFLKFAHGDDIDDILWDATILSALFHDCAKGRETWDGPWTDKSTPDHAAVSAEFFIHNVSFDVPELTRKVYYLAYRAIQEHMSRWSPHPVRYVWMHTDVSRAVALADYACSFSDIRFAFIEA